MKGKENDHRYHDDQIHKLPDEVLRLILMKVSDPKSLLRCSLVSKHLACMLFHSQSLSLQFPSYSIPSPDEETLLFWLTKLLSRFTTVRSLHVELPCSPPCPCRPNFQFSWVFRDGKKLKTFAFLSTSSISKIDDEMEEESRVPKRPRKHLRWNDHLTGTASSLVLYATLIHRTLLLLFSRHPNMESVEIMDSKKHGEVSLQGEQLRKLKNNMSHSMPPNISEETVMNMNWLPSCFTLWYAEKLRLPRSGFVLEGVTLGVGAVDKYFPGDVDGLVADFENNGDDIFGEALTQLHTSSSFKRQRFITHFRYSKLSVIALERHGDWG